jgi:adenylosuccinate synthase
MNLAILGAQWGDEGKGKVVDLLAPHFSLVARYQGGHNAGHTVYVNRAKFILRLIPSGILHPGTTCVIGNGVVIDPQALFAEVDELTRNGIDVDDRVVISDKAHLILPYHRDLDLLSEARRGERKIGTTSRGIGPAYEDKIARRGIRVCDLADPAGLQQNVRDNVTARNRLVQDSTMDWKPVFDQLLTYAARMRPWIRDVSVLLTESMRDGKSILFEGAQGTLLDVDHGTYPYVTSSNCVAGNASAGAGVGPGMLHYILGITKAYCTRVGGGPFPTELDWEKPGTVGYHLSTVGAEKGVTTGRSRRCGWFDAALLKRSAQVNGLSGLCITKLDVLDGIKELQLCTGYKLDGEYTDILPMGADEISRCEPVYEVMEGWSESTVGVTQFEKLPVNARLYLQRIEQVTGVPIDMISTSPDRDHTIMMRHPYLP